MATATEQGYVDSIASRTDDRPRRRAELSDALYDAEIALTDAAAAIAHQGMVELEGHDDAREELWSRLDDGLERYRQAAKQFEHAVQSVQAFQVGKPGETGSKTNEEAA